MPRKKLPLTDSEQRQRLNAFFMNIDGESDRGCVLVAAAIIDECLEVLLRSRLLQDDPKLINSLFSGQGPLSSFWSKIQFARALNVIPSWVHEDLERIRSLRNLFAHRYDSADFDDNEVVSITSKLQGANYTVEAIKAYETTKQSVSNSTSDADNAAHKLKDKLQPPSKKERIRFIFSVSFICAELEAQPKLLALKEQIVQQKLQLWDSVNPKIA